MSDQVQIQETGGGEGSATPASKPIPAQVTAEEIKLTETKELNDQKDDKVEDNKVIKDDENSVVKNEKNQATSSLETKSQVVTQEPTGETPVTNATAHGTETESNISPKEMGDWQQRELELLKKIAELEKVKTDRTEDGLKLELKVREEEIDLLKARVKNLETELQAAMSKPSGKNHEMIENIKQQHEELLSKARGMIFDKTKMVKNQELQIEALTTQVQSLKDINQITKDLLEIRNSEVKAMEDRLQVMEAKFKAEKERYDLVLKRAATSTNINADLRKEYETQLAIFKELRAKYEERVQALVAENNRLKESVKGGSSG